jgi:hypothetical protein
MSGGGIIVLHSDLSEPSCEEFGFGFQYLELCGGFVISSHHLSEGAVCLIMVLAFDAIDLS